MSDEGEPFRANILEAQTGLVPKSPCTPFGRIPEPRAFEPETGSRIEHSKEDVSPVIHRP